MQKSDRLAWRVWESLEDDSDPSAIDVASAFDLRLIARELMDR